MSETLRLAVASKQGVAVSDYAYETIEPSLLDDAAHHTESIHNKEGNDE